MYKICNHSMTHYTLKAMKIYFLPKYTPHFADNAETIGISLGDILSFVTGLRNIPPIGFEKKIMVEFFDEERLPNASTCSLILRLPRHLVEEEEFKQKMIFPYLEHVVLETFDMHI